MAQGASEPPQLDATCHMSSLFRRRFLAVSVLSAQFFLTQLLPQKGKIPVKEKDVLIVFSFFCF